MIAGSGLIAAGSGWLVAYLKKKQHELETARTQRSVSVVIDSAAIYDELNLLAGRVDCDRVLLLASSNGGGIPDAGSPLTVSVLYEVIRGDGLQPIRLDWQSIPLDEAYISMLRELITSNAYYGGIDDLKKGMLKDLYISEGVTHFHIVPILRTEKKFYYLSVRWLNDRTCNDETVRTCMSAASHRLESILKRTVPGQ